MNSVHTLEQIQKCFTFGKIEYLMQTVMKGFSTKLCVIAGTEAQNEAQNQTKLHKFLTLEMTRWANIF